MLGGTGWKIFFPSDGLKIPPAVPSLESPHGPPSTHVRHSTAVGNSQCNYLRHRFFYHYIGPATLHTAAPWTIGCAGDAGRRVGGSFSHPMDLGTPLLYPTARGSAILAHTPPLHRDITHSADPLVSLTDIFLCFALLCYRPAHQRWWRLRRG